MEPKLPYYDKLVKIRKFLDNYYENDKFPMSKCQETSKLVAQIIPGLEEVAGHYKSDNFYTNNKGHVWNYDPAHNVYVDLSMDQFDVSHNNVMILELDTSLLQQCDRYTNLIKKGEGQYGVSEINTIVEAYKNK